MVHSIPSIANVLLVCGVFWLIFSVMGFNLFGGKFFRCVDKNQQLLPRSVVNTMKECTQNASQTGYRWTNRNINFDDAINGIIALFQTVSSYYQTEYVLILKIATFEVFIFATRIKEHFLSLTKY